MSRTHVTRNPKKMHPKGVDIHFTFDRFLGPIVLAADAGSTDITAAVTAAMTTIGRNNTPVPVQVSTDINTTGVLVGADAQISEVNDSNTGGKFEDGGDEVYARVTEAGGVFTATFNKSDGAGADTAVTLLSGASLWISIAVRVPFDQLPDQATRGTQKSQISQDAQVPSTQTHERVAVTALNTLANLAGDPRPGAPIEVHVDHGLHYVLDLEPGITIAGRAITWDAAQMTFDLETTDIVTVSYIAL